MWTYRYALRAAVAGCSSTLTSTAFLQPSREPSSPFHSSRRFPLVANNLPQRGYAFGVQCMHPVELGDPVGDEDEDEADGIVAHDADGAEQLAARS